MEWSGVVIASFLVGTSLDSSLFGSAQEVGSSLSHHCSGYDYRAGG